MLMLLSLIIAVMAIGFIWDLRGQPSPRRMWRKLRGKRIGERRWY